MGKGITCLRKIIIKQRQIVAFTSVHIFENIDFDILKWAVAYLQRKNVRIPYELFLSYYSDIIAKMFWQVSSLFLHNTIKKTHTIWILLMKWLANLHIIMKPMLGLKTYFRERSKIVWCYYFVLQVPILFQFSICAAYLLKLGKHYSHDLHNNSGKEIKQLLT